VSEFSVPGWLDPQCVPVSILSQRNSVIVFSVRPMYTPCYSIKKHQWIASPLNNLLYAEYWLLSPVEEGFDDNTN
jgi:hypothetical protein